MTCVPAVTAVSVNNDALISQSPVSTARGTAVGRWSGVGPYYAMFPVAFAFETIAKFTRPGDAVLDPFAGRATSIYAAAAQGRTGYGVELNPVGWVYAKAKLQPATQAWVLRRIEQVSVLANAITDAQVDELPEFFHHCYCRRVLKYLLAARSSLRWEDTLETRASGVDTTLMAFLLIHLHGKLGTALSNQMRQGKAMDPTYSVRWWSARNMRPPEIDPVEFLRARVDWRYRKGLPVLSTAHVELGDSTTVLKRLAPQRRAQGKRIFDLVLTSPPYLAVTNYFYDQWLRLWMLGGEPSTVASGKKWENKFESKVNYRELLTKVFEGCAANVSDNAVIYVRTDARKFTFETTHDVLRQVFPGKSVRVVQQAYKKATQTALYGDKSEKPGEVDIVLEGRLTRTRLSLGSGLTSIPHPAANDSNPPLFQ